MPLRRRRAPAWAAVLLLPVLWLAGDAVYSLRIHSRAGRPGIRRAAIEPFSLNPDGNPALLLIHGFADGPSVFEKIAPPLADAGLAVRALHLPGSGIPAPEMAGTTLAVWRKAIDREIAALRAADPERPVWLVGHSLGGTLAFDAALRPGNGIAGLVLLAPLLAPSDVRSPLLGSRQWFQLLSRALVFTTIVESRLPPDLRDPVARASYQTDQFIHRDIYRALFETLDSVRPRAAEWDGPLLMVVSPTDRVVDTPTSAKFLFEATNARPARLSELYAGGHVLPLDFGHEKIARKIIAFIRSPSRP